MASQDTLRQHAHIIQAAQKRFQEKATIYGDSWQIMDIHYIANRIMVKCERIMRLLKKPDQQVEDDIATELIDIINYALIALMQIQRASHATPKPLSTQDTEVLYDACVKDVRNILTKKNHDYNDAWRKMQYPSLITQIKVKLSRVLNTPSTLLSTHAASVQDQYEDIVNYAVFAHLHPDVPYNVRP